MRGPCGPDELPAAGELYWWLLWSDSPRGPWRLLDEPCRPTVPPDREREFRQTHDLICWVARAAHVPARTAQWAMVRCHGTGQRAEVVLTDGRPHPGLEACVDPWDDWSDQLLGNPMAPVDWKALAIDVLLGHFAAACLGLRGFLKGTRVSTYIWGRRYAWWGVVYMLGAWWLARSIG